MRPCSRSTEGASLRPGPARSVSTLSASRHRRVRGRRPRTSRSPHAAHLLGARRASLTADRVCFTPATLVSFHLQGFPPDGDRSLSPGSRLPCRSCAASRLLPAVISARGEADRAGTTPRLRRQGGACVRRAAAAAAAGAGSAGSGSHSGRAGCRPGSGSSSARARAQLRGESARAGGRTYRRNRGNRRNRAQKAIACSSHHCYASRKARRQARRQAHRSRACRTEAGRQSVGRLAIDGAYRLDASEGVRRDVIRLRHGTPAIG